jgi:hypothetical protein
MRRSCMTHEREKPNVLRARRLRRVRNVRCLRATPSDISLSGVFMLALLLPSFVHPSLPQRSSGASRRPRGMPIGIENGCGTKCGLHSHSSDAEGRREPCLPLVAMITALLRNRTFLNLCWPQPRSVGCGVWLACVSPRFRKTPRYLALA